MHKHHHSLRTCSHVDQNLLPDGPPPLMRGLTVVSLEEIGCMAPWPPKALGARPLLSPGAICA
eukprot:5002278-Pleurochrysis_carterae.AAC.1